MRAGTANIFLRFAGCNLTCRRETEGFDCDTEFASGRRLTSGEIITWVSAIGGLCKNIIFTGGEPSLQLDDALITELKQAGYFLAVETNGTSELPRGLDWITVSPKTAEHTIRQQTASELKYVRSAGMAIPKPSARAQYYLISPAFQSDGTVKQEDIEWCIALVKDNPLWRLSVQLHKMLKQR